MSANELIKQNEILIEENHRLKTAVEELSALNEIATAITSTQPLEQIVDLIIIKCIKHIKAEQGVVMLLDEKNENKPFYTMIRKQDSRSNALPFKLDAQLTGWMLKNKNSLLINDLSKDERFKIIVDENFRIHSLLCVPMMVKEKMIGLIAVFNKKSNDGFTNNDKRLLGIIAAQSAHVIEHARLYQEEQTLIRFREEMRLAFEIQSDLLPKKNPDINGYKIAGKSIPAKDIGGDYFDFISIDETHLAFCLADISGKGIPAALLMSNLQATLRGQSLMNKSCSECVSFANDILYHNTASNNFATLFYGILNNKTQEITFCNAGHNFPILFSQNKITQLDKSGIIIGFMPSVIYEESKTTLNPGDILLIFSDGITEAVNKSDEEFGEQRLIDIILKNRNESPEIILENIIKEIKIFSLNKDQYDDMTLIIIKRETN